MNITKQLLNRLVKEELESYEMVPGTGREGVSGVVSPVQTMIDDEDDERYQTIDDTTDMSFSDEEGAVIETDPVEHWFSAGAPGSEGGPPVASFPERQQEGRLTKNTLHHMILEELDALQEAGITGKKMFRGRKSRRRGLKPNWGTVGAGVGGFALGSMLGAAAAGGSRRRPSYPESRMSDRYHPSYRDAPPSYGGHPSSYNMTPGVPRGRSMMGAEQLYDAMKGGGTDEELIWDVLESNFDTRKIRQLSRAYDRVLAMNDDTDDGSLVQWLRDDGMDQAAKAVLMLMNGQEIDRYQIKFMREEDDA